MYGWAVRNVHNSTRFWVRRRHLGKRHIEVTDIAVPLTPKRPDPPVRKLRTLLWLGAPGFWVAFLGGVGLSDHGGTVVSTAYTSVFLALSLIFTLRAAHARAPRWIRAVGVAFSLLFPVLWALTRLGVIG